MLMSTQPSKASTSLTSTEMLSIIAEVIAYAVGLVVTAFLTNYLSSIGYSRVALGLYTLALVYPLMMRGANKTVLTYLSQYVSEKNSTKVASFLSWELRCFVWGGIVFIAALAVVATSIYFIDPSFYQSDYGIVLIFICLVPLWAFLGLQGNVLLSLKQYRAYFVCDVVSQPVWCAILLALTVLIHGSLGFTQVIFTYFGSYGISIIGQSIWLGIQPNTKSLIEIWQTNITSADRKTWRGYSLQLFANIELSYMQSSAGVYILQFFASDATAVGLYAVISAVANVFYLIWKAMSTILSALISENASSAKGQALLQSVINSMNLSQLLLGGVVYLVIFFFAGSILNMFGAHYTQVATLLRIYTGIQFLNMFNTSGITILSYAGRAKESVALNVLNLILVLVVGSLAAYYYNTSGLVITLALASFVVSLIACGMVRHYYNIKVMTLF
jgi:O-antigen/teichoic acid export membrane protein